MLSCILYTVLELNIRTLAKYSVFEGRIGKRLYCQNYEILWFQIF